MLDDGTGNLKVKIEWNLHATKKKIYIYIYIYVCVKNFILFFIKLNYIF